MKAASTLAIICALGANLVMDVPTTCAQGTTSCDALEAQRWEDTGMVPNKIPAVPVNLLTLEFSSGMTVIHEEHLVTTDKIKQAKL